MSEIYSNQVREFTIEPGCPWYEAQQSYGAPNVNWCEPTVCSLINEPANTWSNLGYLLIGLVLVKKMQKAPINAFPWAVLVMGLLSGIYHASNNYLTQFFDFVGMFLMMSFLFTFNFKRVFKNSMGSFFSLFWFIVFVNTMLFMVFDIIDSSVQKMMILNAVPAVLLDFFAGYRDGLLKKYGYFLLAILSLVVAQGFAVIDIQRIWCEPSNAFLHGHVLWHLIGSLGMLFVGLHIKRMFEES